ncbi:unnamed protein product, partial [Discosporangium mesarthrocarpum]
MAFFSSVANTNPHPPSQLRITTSVSLPNTNPSTGQTTYVLTLLVGKDATLPRIQCQPSSAICSPTTASTLAIPTPGRSCEEAEKGGRCRRPSVGGDDTIHDIIHKEGRKIIKRTVIPSTPVHEVWGGAPIPFPGVGIIALESDADDASTSPSDTRGGGGAAWGRENWAGAGEPIGFPGVGITALETDADDSMAIPSDTGEGGLAAWGGVEGAGAAEPVEFPRIGIVAIGTDA